MAEDNLSSVTGLPDELNIEDDLSKSTEQLTVAVEDRRYNKSMTVVSGFEDADLDSLSSELKSKMACGGTTTEDSIELQGSHADRVTDILRDKGFTVTSA